MESQSDKNTSAVLLWKKFTERHPEFATQKMPPVFYFCDNETDADECAELVMKGIKQATATSLWWFETHKATLPKVGDLSIVTNWKGKALALIETTGITITPYNQVSAEFAATEGEDDRSLEYWRRVHKAFFTREMKSSSAEFDEDMPLVCEEFRTLFWE